MTHHTLQELPVTKVSRTKAQVTSLCNPVPFHARISHAQPSHNTNPSALPSLTDFTPDVSNTNANLHSPLQEHQHHARILPPTSFSGLGGNFLRRSWGPIIRFWGNHAGWEAHSSYEKFPSSYALPERFFHRTRDLLRKKLPGSPSKSAVHVIPSMASDSYPLVR
jgi:hypothetical protein